MGVDRGHSEWGKEPTHWRWVSVVLLILCGLVLFGIIANMERMALNQKTYTWPGFVSAVIYLVPWIMNKDGLIKKLRKACPCPENYEVEVTVYRDKIALGSDSGILFHTSNLLCFTGLQSSFALDESWKCHRIPKGKRFEVILSKDESTPFEDCVKVSPRTGYYSKAIQADLNVITEICDRKMGPCVCKCVEPLDPPCILEPLSLREFLLHVSLFIAMFLLIAESGHLYFSYRCMGVAIFSLLLGLGMLALVLLFSGERLRRVRRYRRMFGSSPCDSIKGEIG